VTKDDITPLLYDADNDEFRSRSLLFWDLMTRRLVVSYGRFR
jgi:hypothetical protein